MVIFLVLRLRGIHSPPKLFYPLTLFMMEFPDVDHLYWMQVKPTQIVPFTIWDLFRWELRTEYYTSTFLHYWVYPFILLILLAAPLAGIKRWRWVVVGVFLGWTVHLVLDGVIRFI